MINKSEPWKNAYQKNKKNILENEESAVNTDSMSGPLHNVLFAGGGRGKGPDNPLTNQEKEVSIKNSLPPGCELSACTFDEQGNFTAGIRYGTFEFLVEPRNVTVLKGIHNYEGGRVTPQIEVAGYPNESIGLYEGQINKFSFCVQETIKALGYFSRALLMYNIPLCNSKTRVIDNLLIIGSENPVLIDMKEEKVLKPKQEDLSSGGISSFCKKVEHVLLNSVAYSSKKEEKEDVKVSVAKLNVALHCMGKKPLEEKVDYSMVNLYCELKPLQRNESRTSCMTTFKEQ